MSCSKTLHILNGQAMYEHFRKNGFLEGELLIPFNEAMCYGDSCADLFSNQFAEMRSKVHNVPLGKYKEITLTPLEPLINGKFTGISMWFDTDMFCQINVLTILGWLDKIAYSSEVELHIVGENFEPINHLKLSPKGYYEIYKQVLVEKNMPNGTLPDILQKGIELYLNYLNEDSEPIQYILEHNDVQENELMLMLLRKFNEYGLGDTQYLAIIKSVRQKFS